MREYTVYYGHVAVNAARTPQPPAYTEWAEVKMATEGQSEYESVLCVKPEVNVYRIPPRASNRAIRWEGQRPGGALSDPASAEPACQLSPCSRSLTQLTAAVVRVDVFSVYKVTVENAVN